MSNNNASTGLSHESIETNNFLMIVLILLVLLVGGLVEIVPLFFQKSTTEPIKGVQPYTALQLAGRDIYTREGCYNCHSQMIRPFRAETLRYGHYSVAGESVYDHPFQWGSKRTGPDLARVGGKYSDNWHVIHLTNPRDVVPESNMPAYAFLAANPIDPAYTEKKMKVLGFPYTPAEIQALATQAERGIRQHRRPVAGDLVGGPAAFIQGDGDVVAAIGRGQRGDRPGRDTECEQRGPQKITRTT